MLAALQKILSFELAVVEWIVLAVIAGSPYLAVGWIWVISHADRFAGLDSVDLITAIGGAIVSWPVLLVLPAC